MYKITDLDVIDGPSFIDMALMYGLYVRREALSGPNGYEVYDVAHHDKHYLIVAMAKIYYDDDAEMAEEMVEEA